MVALSFFSRAKLLLAVMYRSPDGKDEVSLSPIYISRIARILAVNFTRTTYSSRFLNRAAPYKYTEGVSLIYYV